MPWNVRYFPLPAFVLIWPSPSNFSSSRILCSFFASISILHFAPRILWKSFSRRRCLISASEKSSRRARILSSPPYELFFELLSKYRRENSRFGLANSARGLSSALSRFLFFFFLLRRFSRSPELISRDTAICTVARRKWARFPVNVRLTLNSLANGITQT